MNTEEPKYQFTPVATDCYANLHMTAEEYGVWDVLRAVSHKSGHILYFSGQEVACLFRDMGLNRPYVVLRALSDQGWAKCVKQCVRLPSGHWSHTEWKILDHAEWAGAHPEACAEVAKHNAERIAGRAAAKRKGKASVGEVSVGGKTAEAPVVKERPEIPADAAITRLAEIVSSFQPMTAIERKESYDNLNPDDQRLVDRSEYGEEFLPF